MRYEMTSSRKNLDSMTSAILMCHCAVYKLCILPSLFVKEVLIEVLHPIILVGDINKFNNLRFQGVIIAYSTLVSIVQQSAALSFTELNRNTIYQFIARTDIGPTLPKNISLISDSASHYGLSRQ